MPMPTKNRPVRAKIYKLGKESDNGESICLMPPGTPIITPRAVTLRGVLPVVKHFNAHTVIPIQMAKSKLYLTLARHAVGLNLIASRSQDLLLQDITIVNLECDLFTNILTSNRAAATIPEDYQCAVDARHSRRQASCQGRSDLSAPQRNNLQDFKLALDRDGLIEHPRQNQLGLAPQREAELLAQVGQGASVGRSAALAGRRPRR